jgi:thiamine-phosphate pyrophosphorylase
MIEGGVDIMQLRAKGYISDDVKWFAEQLLTVTQAGRIPLVINDFPEVAAHVNAEGVHLGQEDGSLEKAHHLAGYRTLMGRSTHSVEQAGEAEKEGADYIGFGPLYYTLTKRDYMPIGLGDIARVHQQVGIPIFCIGGINLENLEEVIEAGARRVVIVSGILQSRNVVAYCNEAKSMLLAHKN